MGLSQDFPATAIAGIFGATQQARAAKEAMRILQEARQTALTRVGQLDAQFDPFIARAGQSLDESRALLARTVAETQGMDVGAGLSGADRIAYEDAAKLLNEQLVSTGNLRSGAAAFGQAQLLRRVVADANQRRFDRQAAKLNLLYGAAGQTGQLGQAAGQIGLYGKSFANTIFGQANAFSSEIASAALGKGRAFANQILSYGAAADEVAHTAIDAAKAYFSMGASEMMDSGGGGGGAKSAPWTSGYQSTNFF